MKFYVATWVRVGSTWISQILMRLQEQPGRYAFKDIARTLGSAVTSEQLQSMKQVEGAVVKTHAFTPLELAPLANGNTYVVGARRNFLDAFVSLVIYEKTTRRAQGLPIARPIQSLLDIYPDIGDAALINLLIESQWGWVEEQIHDWYLFNRNTLKSNTVIVNYDKWAQDYESRAGLVDYLNKFIGASREVVESTKQECSFTAMQKKHDPGFVRKGEINGWTNYLDRRAVDKINRRIAQLEQS